MGALFIRELRLATRSGGGATIGLLFFFAVIVIVPFAVGPDPQTLARIGPAMLWIAVLLSSLLGLERLFAADREDGSLDLLLMADERHWLPVVIAVKCAAHWTANVAPTIAAVPLLGLTLALDAPAIGATLLTLLLGTPAITFIGAVGAAVTVSLPRGGLLLTILVLPLLVPVVIFGVAAVYGAANDPDPFLAPILILTALSLFFAVLGPFAAALALRHGGE